MHKVLDQTEFKNQEQSIPLSGAKEDKGKPHRVTFNIGCFNDGLRSSFCKNNSKLIIFSGFRRLLTMFDETTFGV